MTARFPLLAIFLGASLNVSAAAPAEFIGPESCYRYEGVVTAAKKVKETVGTSDVSAQELEFLEVYLKVSKAERIEFPVFDPETAPVKNAPPVEPKVTPMPNLPEPMRFYFAAGEKIRAGDRLEVTTRTNRQISHGWTSGEHGAAYKKLDR